MGKINISELKKKAIVVREIDYNNIDNSYLRNLRNNLNMSQSLFASYLGVSKKSIEKWEQGKNKINLPVKKLLMLINDDPSILSKMKYIEVEGEKCNYVKFEKQNNEAKVTSEWEIEHSNFKETKKVVKDELKYGYCL